MGLRWVRAQEGLHDTSTLVSQSMFGLGFGLPKEGLGRARSAPGWVVKTWHGTSVAGVVTIELGTGLDELEDLRGFKMKNSYRVKFGERCMIESGFLLQRSIHKAGYSSCSPTRMSFSSRTKALDEFFSCSSIDLRWWNQKKTEEALMPRKNIGDRGCPKRWTLKSFFSSSLRHPIPSEK